MPGNNSGSHVTSQAIKTRRLLAPSTDWEQDRTLGSQHLPTLGQSSIYERAPMPSIPGKHQETSFFTSTLFLFILIKILNYFCQVKHNQFDLESDPGSFAYENWKFG